MSSHLCFFAPLLNIKAGGRKEGTHLKKEVTKYIFLQPYKHADKPMTADGRKSNNIILRPQRR